MDNVLPELKLFIDQLNQTNSNLDKLAVLKTASANIQRILKEVYNDLNVLGVRSANCIKNEDIQFGWNDLPENKILPEVSLLEVFQLLIERRHTGNSAIMYVNLLISQNKEYKELIYNCIDRDLKCGVSKSSINKALPGLIPEFKCALANSLDEKLATRIDLYEYLIMKKLDGCRCLTFISNSDCKFFSRTGKEFDTLHLLKENLMQYFSDKPGRYVIDGEICIMENGKEVFSSIIKQIGRKDHTILEPFYQIFDIMTEHDFFGNTQSECYSQRLSTARTILNKESPYFEILKTVRYNEDSFEKMKARSANENWEGLILRKDVPYVSGRSNSLLKYKLFQDAEYKVLDVTRSEKQMLVNGAIENLECIGALVIEHKGKRVQVGSGLSDAQRLHWFDYPEDIIGKEITVKYFEETKDQDGEYSLRFPTLKAIHGNKRDN